MFAEGDFSKRSLAIAETLYTRKAGFSSRFDLAVLYLENGKLTQAETILNGTHS